MNKTIRKDVTKMLCKYCSPNSGASTSNTRAGIREATNLYQCRSSAQQVIPKHQQNGKPMAPTRSATLENGASPSGGSTGNRIAPKEQF